MPRESAKILGLLMRTWRKSVPKLYHDDYCGPKKAKAEGFQRIVASGGQPPTSRAG